MIEKSTRNDRHNPLGKLDYLSIQHLERYMFAITQLKPGWRVLDIACGTGYGTTMLKNHGCHIVGADLDGKLIEQTAAEWNHKDFIIANALNLPFANESFDAVVSFETIEHVVDGFHFIKEICRVIKSGGIFICSTPNIKYTAHPPFHLKEYGPNDFYNLIDIFYASTTKYGQYFTWRDRLKDILNWHLRRLLDNSVCKISPNFLFKKSTFNSCLTNITATFKSIYHDRSVDEKVDKVELNSNRYGVQKLNDFKLLRIMIVVGRK